MVFNFLKKKSVVPSLPPVVAAEKIKTLSNVLFIDVREVYELMEGSAMDTINLPTSTFSISQLPEDKNIPLFFICRSGGRSAKAAELAKLSGYTQVFNVSGGTEAWGSMGLPMK